MQAEFDTFNGKPIEDSNWYFVISIIIGKRRANRWVKQIAIPLNKEPDG